MRGTLIKVFRLTVCWLFFSSFVTAQSELPKIYPSTTRDYSELASFPTVCFDKAYTDSDGRLWIGTCFPESTNRMYLFLFDGYEFNLVSGALDSMKFGSKIERQLNDHTFVGTLNQEEPSFFVADLKKQQVDYYQLPYEIYHHSIHIRDQQEVLMIGVAKNAWAIMKWSGESVEVNYIDYPHSTLNPDLSVLAVEDHYFWSMDFSNQQLHKVNFNNKVIDSYIIDPKFSETTGLQFKRYSPPIPVVAGNFLRMRDEKGYYFLQGDSITKTFQPISNIPFRCDQAGLFQDNSNNYILYYEYQKQIKGILYRNDGAVLDYSPVLESYDEYAIRNIIGEDFSKEVLVSTVRGLKSHLLADAGLIQQYIRDEAIRGMQEILPGEIFVKTQRGRNFFLNLNTQEVIEDPLDCNLNYRSMVLKEDSLLIGAAQKGLIQLNPYTGYCETSFNEIRNILQIAEYKDRLVLTTQDGGVYLYDEDNNTIQTIEWKGEHLKIDSKVNDLLTDDQFIWIATSTGLWKIDPENGQHAIINDPKLFSDSRFLSVTLDGENLWLGSFLGGAFLYHIPSGEVQQFNIKTGLPNNSVVSIQIDQDNYKWIATYDGVALLDDQNKWIRNFDTQDGLAHKEANRYSDLITQAGQVLIGSLNGLSVIDAKKAKQDFLNPSINKIYLTSVGFHDPKNGFQEIIWPNQLQDLGRITLPAKDRELTLSFAHSNYGNANLNRFSYRLCDDEEWTDIGGRNTLEFKDLRAGNHELWVQGYSMNGQATTNQIYLDFKVIPRFYESWWFYVFCIMSVLGIGLFWIQRLRWAVSKATATIEADKKIIEEQAEKLKELDAAKSRFFTNISHEFRTPLTIISGVADQLENKSRAELIRKNSNRLLRLINQILDLRKLEYSKVTFNMVQGNVVAYLSYLADTYATYTKNKNIDFSFIAPEEAIVMDYDPDKLADIISNLVSNALKHTQEGDAVSITIQTVELNEKEHCEITINDTGSGIPADKIPFIFDRFFKAETDNKRWDSTGIGLSLVQELVTNLGGQINVESQVDEGSVFTVLLPIELNATTHHDVGKPAGITRSDQSDAAKMGPGSQNTILIVEDHPDLIDFMRSILEDTYIVHSARDGFAGEERAYELVPDLIISDIMMPGQDGLELCEKLKNDRRTDHIPIILLTAMADIETKLEALQKRSDAFLGKPFDQAELKLTILNLLEQRAQLQRKYGNGASSDLNNAPKTPSDLFVDQLNEVIDQNLEKEGFSVPELCRGMALGRTQLHNKIKALTGRSTTGYIRYRRLLKARQLLKAGELNISEVAYATGFKSPNYFSTSFTDEFGMPPSKL